MDIIRFHNPSSPTYLQQGEIVNGLTNKLWIERYLPAGEFTFVGPVNKGLREALPIGALISHTNTTEVMIVENHEINDQEGQESTITITGRGFETFFENRIIGSNKTFPGTTPQEDYTLTYDYLWNQALQLLVEHYVPGIVLDSNYSMDHVATLANWCGTTDPQTTVAVRRPLKRGPVYDELLKLLAIQNLGIRIVRPGPWSPIGAPFSLTITSPSDATKEYLAIIIHRGQDSRGFLIFSYDSGALASADYLWSGKNKKNAALVTSKWFEVVVNPTGATGYNRRMMYIDASEIDKDFEAIPTGIDETNVLNELQQKGIDAIAPMKDLALTKAEVSRQAIKPIYRTDYVVGDQGTIRGDYNESVDVRVTEYVEIEDENGESGYPTLAIE